jgi:protein involved in plasmid replication-relaxation
MSQKNIEPKPRQRNRKPSKRDIDIVRAVYDFHVLRQDQLQRLFFNSPSTTSQVLSRLCERGYIDFKFVPVIRGQGSSPKFYVLDRRGADLLELEDWTHAKKDFKDITFLEHLTGINDFLITVMKATKIPGYRLLTWKGEAEMKAAYDRVDISTPSGQLIKVSLIPDAYCAIRTPDGTAHVFLEYDRGRSSAKRFKRKILAYQEYIGSPTCEDRYGTKALRVLTIVLNPRRLQTLKTATEQVGGRHRFWFALDSDITAETIFSEPNWVIAGRQGKRAFLRSTDG